jgi:rod shape determining protein RodA
MLILLLLAAVGMVVMHSAVGSTDARFADQARNFYVALFAMWVVAVTPPSVILKLAVPFYVLGILLLVAVMFVGETSKGATRWLNLGITRIQPSEMMKIAVPLMLAWYFHKREGPMKFLDLCAASLLLLVPFLLIVKQPDLGTAILVFGAGFFVIYFAGISFKLLIVVDFLQESS